MTIFYSQNIKSQKNVHKIVFIILTIIVICIANANIFNVHNF